MNLEEVLVDKGILSPEELSECKSLVGHPDNWLGSVLSEKGIISEESLAKLISESTGLKFIDLRHFEVDFETSSTLPYQISVENHALLLANRLGLLVVGFVDPTRQGCIENVRKFFGYDFSKVVITHQQLLEQLENLGSDPDQGIPNAFNLDKFGFDLYNSWIEKYTEKGFLDDQEIEEVAAIIKKYGDASMLKADSLSHLKKNERRSRNEAREAMDERVDAYLWEHTPEETLRHFTSEDLRLIFPYSKKEEFQLRLEQRKWFIENDTVAKAKKAKESRKRSFIVFLILLGGPIGFLLILSLLMLIGL